MSEYAMLAFDIETMGLKAGRDDITIVCTENFFTREKKAYEFGKLKAEMKIEEYEALVVKLIDDLNDASSLCAFNGVNFDIPFIQKTFHVPDNMVTAWKAKMSDIFYFCKHNYMHTFGLNLLCEKNNVPMKISTGTAAIDMARNQEWDALKAYCEMDVSILNNLYEKRYVLNPRNNAIMDLSFMTKERLYSDSPHPLQALKTLDEYTKIIDTSTAIMNEIDESNNNALSAKASSMNVDAEQGVDWKQQQRSPIESVVPRQYHRMTLVQGVE